MKNRMKDKLLLSVTLLVCSTLPGVSLANEAIDQSTESKPFTGIFEELDLEDSNFSSYRPSYFGIVVDHSDKDTSGDAEFQLSLKYKLTEKNNLYFGFSQIAKWSIDETSAPFREINFSPELFYIQDKKVNEGLVSIQYGFFRHESTGEDGAGSRGWNTSYIEPEYHLIFKNQHKLIIEPQLRVIVFGGSKSKWVPDNKDIFDYYGNVDINLTYIFSNNHQVSSMYRQGNENDYHGFRFRYDAAVKSSIFRYIPLLRNLDNAKVFVKYWTGYGETLKNYNRDTESFVIGLTAVR
ncbi:MAG: phospholipase A [Gammaproteobacteria bacterium]|nr:phospholipase A [Gammaproteobacteria bacterium]